MIENIGKYLSEIFINNSYLQLGVVLMSSIVIGSVVCITYRFSYSRAIYSKSFNMSLMMFTILSSISICILSENLNLAIGAIGALSVVRYRNAIKDHRDIIFILWAVIAGICSGLAEYMAAGIGSLVISIIIVLFGAMHNSERFLVVVRGMGNMENPIIEVFNKVFRGKAKLKVNNSTEKITELIFQLPELDLKKRVSITQDIKKQLYAIDKIEAVNILSQTEDMGV